MLISNCVYTPGGLKALNATSEMKDNNSLKQRDCSISITLKRDAYRLPSLIAVTISRKLPS